MENELPGVCTCERVRVPREETFGEENGAENQRVAEAFYWSRMMVTKKCFHKNKTRNG